MIELLAPILDKVHGNVSDLALCILSFAVYVLWKIQDSLASLNTKIAVIIDRIDNHEKRLDKLEDS